MNDLRHWYVVRTKPRKEGYAQDQLTRRGVDTFLPRILERGLDGPVVAALFPGYLFAHANLALQHNAIIWAPGVRRLVSFGDTPTPVDDEVVDFIRQRCGKEGVVRSEPSFRPGEWVRVKRGPLEGLLGMVDAEVSGPCRVRVLMELLRRRTRVSIPIEFLEHASL